MMPGPSPFEKLKEQCSCQSSSKAACRKPLLEPVESRTPKEKLNYKTKQPT